MDGIYDVADGLSAKVGGVKEQVVETADFMKAVKRNPPPAGSQEWRNQMEHCRYLKDSLLQASDDIVEKCIENDETTEQELFPLEVVMSLSETLDTYLHIATGQLRLIREERVQSLVESFKNLIMLDKFGAEALVESDENDERKESILESIMSQEVGLDQRHLQAL